VQLILTVRAVSPSVADRPSADTAGVGATHDGVGSHATHTASFVARVIAVRLSVTPQRRRHAANRAAQTLELRLRRTRSVAAELVNCVWTVTDAVAARDTRAAARAAHFVGFAVAWNWPSTCD